MSSSMHRVSTMVSSDIGNYLNNKKTWDIFINVREYGAKGNGITDDTAAFQKAIEECNEQGGVVLVPPGVYKNKLTLEVDVSKCRIQGVGTAVLDFTSMTDTNAVHLFSSANYSDRYKQVLAAISGLALIGTYSPGVPLLGKVGLYIGHPTYEGNALFTIEHISIDGFEHNMEFTDNAWRVYGYHISSRWGKHVVPSGLNNFGENMGFENCAFFDGPSSDWEIGSGTFHFKNCSFDNCSVITPGESNVFIDHCHFEMPGGNLSSVYLIDVAHSESFVNVMNTIFVAPNPNIPSFNSAYLRVIDTNTKLGLSLKNVRVFTVTNFNPEVIEGNAVFVAGNGRVQLNGVSSSNNDYNYVIAKSANVIYNGDGEIGNTTGWVTSGTGSFAADNAVFKHGSWSLRATATAGQGIEWSQNFSVEPQKLVVYQMWAKTTIAGTGSATMKIEYFNKKGDSILSAGFEQITSTEDWSIKRFAKWSIAPIGADYARIVGFVSGVGGTTQFWMDDVIVNVL